ncbi:iron(III) transport system permease protein [Nitratireductor aquibiodomus]|uniref:Iron(III) transport system permease protein n=1 Tax=Nitratireductor aquibiodomus TaxID=204799 RepID=A0A1H4MPA4_9HYPH|nr:iron ABC transporter permease [Nitratireductor aquibiodomus]SEB84980.1 iron(III) transport system permease protein [Nitratireductor aquibiodomus]
MNTQSAETTLTPPRVGPAIAPLSRSSMAQWLIFIITAVLVLAPALPILLQVFVAGPLYERDWHFTFANIGRLLGNEAIGEIALTTLAFAGLTTVIAQVLGVAAALLFGRTDMPGRRVMGDMMMWPLYLSHLIMVVGWLIVYGPSGFLTQAFARMFGDAPWNLYSIPGMAIVAGVSQAPLAYLYCLYGVARSIDPTLESAARTCGAGPLTVMRRVTLPLMLPAIVTSSALNIVIAVEMLSIPLFLGRPARIDTLSSYLYLEGIGASNPQHGMVAASALVLVVLVGATLMLQRLLLSNGHRYETVKGKGTRPAPLQLGALKWPLFTLAALYIVFVVLVPILGLVLRAFTSYLTPLIPVWQVLTLQNFKDVFQTDAYMRALWNTLIISVAAAGLGTLLTALIALVIQRSSFPFRRTLEALAYSPRMVPGLITGLGVFYAAIVFAPFGWLRDSIWILVVAYVMATIPLGLGAVQPSVVQIGADLDKAARTVGADWITSMRRILLPLMKPALLGCFILLFVVHLKSYVVAIFLMAPGLEIMGVTMLGLWENGAAGVTAAFATLQIVMIAILLIAARLVFGVKLYE